MPKIVLKIRVVSAHLCSFDYISGKNINETGRNFKNVLYN